MMEKFVGPRQGGKFNSIFSVDILYIYQANELPMKKPEVASNSSAIKKTHRKNKKDSMGKYERLLHIFILLKKERHATKDLMQKLPDIDEEIEKNPKSVEKLITRSLKDLAKLGFTIDKTSVDYQIDKNSDWRLPLSKLIRDFLYEKTKKQIYGDIDTLALVSLFETTKWTAEDFLILAEALTKSYKLSFTYTPQHPETAKRVSKLIRRLITEPRGKVNITMVPHYLVFRAQKILVLGEIYYKNQFLEKHYPLNGMTVIRHDKKGAVKKLKLNPEEIYRYSVEVWAGGEIYDLKIQISDLCDPSNISYIEKKVNGEEEIIRHVLATNGIQKIINPPEIFYQKAAQMGISADRIFVSVGK